MTAEQVVCRVLCSSGMFTAGACQCHWTNQLLEALSFLLASLMKSWTVWDLDESTSDSNIKAERFTPGHDGAPMDFQQHGGTISRRSGGRWDCAGA